jgi:hypothetical protein
MSQISITHSPAQSTNRSVMHYLFELPDDPNIQSFIHSPALNNSLIQLIVFQSFAGSIPFALSLNPLLNYTITKPFTQLPITVTG